MAKQGNGPWGLAFGYNGFQEGRGKERGKRAKPVSTMFTMLGPVLAILSRAEESPSKGAMHRSMFNTEFNNQTNDSYERCSGKPDETRPGSCTPEAYSLGGRLT